MFDITSGPVLVTGGTGTLGRRVVRKLSDSGHQVQTLSRRVLPTPLGSPTCSAIRFAGSACRQP
ncbi:MULTISPECIES: NAD-dependent epimerase/dehydratase family protein [unclassified Arthrobacter]|uniref:NAD-dependent epimerase/dehydratase family protein n=1 Tax=unclassified Arthrobacter TaxID=235627 RepID=UPI0019656925|nr:MULTISPECIES: NAD-dependent epimerase/dehydratase family protein [unclassified Arthrobacter]